MSADDYAERLGNAARAVVDSARNEAAYLGQATVEPEHLLAGLLHDSESVAARALTSVGVTLPAIHYHASRGGHSGSDPAAVALSDRVYRVLAAAADEALALGEFRVDPEHILLALTSEPGAINLVERFRLDSGRIREAVGDVLAAEPTLPGPKIRQDRLTADAAARAFGHFEAPLASLTSLALSGDVAPDVEEFIRNSIQQLHLWRQRDEANPQIFEILIADIAEKLLERLTDTTAIRAALVQLGADDATASDVCAAIESTVALVSDLGGADPVADSRILERIADSTERTAAAVEAIQQASPTEKALPRRLAERAAVGGATAIGKAGAAEALDLLRRSLSDEIAKLQVGLMIAWRAVKDIFTT